MNTLDAQLSVPYPPEWPVKKAVEAYIEENGFRLADYDEPWIKITFWWFTFPFPNLPSRRVAVRFHDLHHVVTGYGTDPSGEAEISAWELRRGVGVFSLFVRSIILNGVLLGMIHSPRRTLAAWRAAHSPAGVGLQPVNLERYEALLKLDIGALRAVYGVPPGGVTGARALHHGAPSRRGRVAS